MQGTHVHLGNSHVFEKDSNQRNDFADKSMTHEPNTFPVGTQDAEASA